MKTHFLLSLFAIITFASCEKKELPITLPAKGDGQVLQVDMGETYDNQFFINLEQQKVVHVSEVESWDLAFSSSASQHGIYVNGGKGMAAYNTNKTKFEDVGYTDTTMAKTSWRYDAPNGSIDSSAIGDWKNKNNVYIIKLNENGTKIRKIQFLQEDAFEYKIAVGDINSTIPAMITITKNAICNYTYFSFELLKTVSGIEPDKNTWDIVVTRYHYTFYDQSPALRYIVNGLLLNPYGSSAYKDSLTDYNTIDENFATSVPLSESRDVIGYDWKTYIIDKGIYTIVKKYNYVIKNRNDHYFKLHFLDFYSSTGVKGSPKFEFKQLM
ncbi:MAG: HmuY family protein [Bacteroidetes bacterium]|nr:HmuY family protein [Bacteroidota bacterium]